jgi:hypothetical protein
VLEEDARQGDEEQAPRETGEGAEEESSDGMEWWVEQVGGVLGVG